MSQASQFKLEFLSAILVRQYLNQFVFGSFINVKMKIQIDCKNFFQERKDFEEKLLL